MGDEVISSAQELWVWIGKFSIMINFVLGLDLPVQTLAALIPMPLAAPA